MENLNVESKIKRDRSSVLQTLWIFLTANYIYCDLLSMMDPVHLNDILSGGELSGLQMTQGFLLMAAVLMTIPIGMILLSKVLNYKANRWANIIAGAIMALVQVGTYSIGSEPTLHYTYYSVIETLCNLFIVYYAWTWKQK